MTKDKSNNDVKRTLEGLKNLQKGFSEYLENLSRDIRNTRFLRTIYRTGGRKKVREGINNLFTIISEAIEAGGTFGVDLLVDVIKSPKLKPALESYLQVTLQGARELAPVLKEFTDGLRPIVQEFQLSQIGEPSVRMVHQIDDLRMMKKYGVDETAKRLVEYESLQDRFAILESEERQLKARVKTIDLKGSKNQIANALIERRAIYEKIDFLSKEIYGIYEEASSLLIVVGQEDEEEVENLD